MRAQLVETATALLAAGDDVESWRAAGFGTLLIPEPEGGFGGDWGDAEAVLRLIGYYNPALDLSPLIVAPAKGEPMLDGALATVALIGGALQRVVEMAIEYANTRVQFGKPIGKQQALQQSLAVLAEETAIVAVVAQAAAEARDRGSAAVEIGAAKLRANRAAAAGVAIGHQTHGAIGFTREYGLWRYTAKLTEWRSAFGNDARWQQSVGAHWLERPGSDLWSAITA